MTDEVRLIHDDREFSLTGDTWRRRFTLLLCVVAVGTALLAYAAVPVLHQSRLVGIASDPESIGVPASVAGCSPIVDDGVYPSPHVGPGTNTPGTGRVSYPTVPPTSGPHFQIPSPMSRRYYTIQDRPPMEELVHNLEHGYVIVWYDASLPPDELGQLRGLTRGGPRQAKRKYLVTPWDQTYGSLSGHHMALAVWGHHQLCDRVSGEAIARFRSRFPIDAAPEPLGS